MNENQEKWDKLIHLPEEYDADPNLAKHTIHNIQTSSRTRSKRFSHKWTGVAACCILVLGLSVFFPIYFSSRSTTVVYYAAGQLETSDIDNMVALQQELSLNFYYYAEEGTQSYEVTVIDTQQTAYIAQEYFAVGEAGFDIITLNIVVMKNAEFDFCMPYKTLSDTFTISDFEITYGMTPNESGYQHLAVFSNEDITYYLAVQSGNNTLDIVEYYLNLLLSPL